MSTGLAILAIGFFLGMRHATDPDHVIAVSTIVARQSSIKKASMIGALWGLGHTVTIFAVGAAIVSFGLVIPARLGLTMEFCVGLVLILLGAMNLTGVTRWIGEKLSPTHTSVSGQHAHLHEHESKLHFHWHSHENAENHHGNSFSWSKKLERSFTDLGWFHALRPLCVGVVHGLAGSAAVGLLVLSTIRDPRWAVLYLLVFGVGTIAGMMLITCILVLPLSFASTRFLWLNRSLILGSGALSLVFGLLVCYRIGFVDGLFSASPRWTPS
jgi:high-affinity nickel permease